MASIKKCIIVIIVMIVANNLYAQYFPIDTARLNSAYRNLVEQPNSRYNQKAFFDAFPSTWMEFIMTYQYIPAEEYDLSMYHLASKHISALGKITLIPDSVYCKKLVDIATGGKLDADAPNYFLSVLHNGMRTKMCLMFNYISQLDTGYQMEFWQFYWSSMHPNKDYETECAYLKTQFENRYPESVQIMCVAYKYFCDGIYLGYPNYPHKASIPWKTPAWTRNSDTP